MCVNKSSTVTGLYVELLELNNTTNRVGIFILWMPATDRLLSLVRSALRNTSNYGFSLRFNYFLRVIKPFHVFIYSIAVSMSFCMRFICFYIYLFDQWSEGKLLSFVILLSKHKAYFIRLLKAEINFSVQVCDAIKASFMFFRRVNKSPKNYFLINGCEKNNAPEFIRIS